MKRHAKSGSSLDDLVARAEREAMQMGLAHIGTEHLLIALAGHGRTAEALAQSAVTVAACRKVAAEILEIHVPNSGPKAEPKLTPRAKHVLALSGALAQESRSELPSPVHVLKAILEFRQGVAISILTRLAVDVDSLEEIVSEVLKTEQERPTSGRT